MEEREFYEKYFTNHCVKEPEIEKQLARIERLGKEINSIRSPETGLFVGIGKGAEMITGKGRLVGLDLPVNQLLINQKQHPENRYVCGDGRLLPFKDGLFDYVVCSEVIEHIEDRSQVIKELWRVLTPNGTIILSTPNWWSFYGLFRMAYQSVFRKELHADDQPVDKWTTPVSLMNELKPSFSIMRIRGSWYWPPTGKGKNQLFPRLFGKLFHFLRPVDLFLGDVLPCFGHSIWIIAQPRKEGSARISEDSVYRNSASLFKYPFIRVLLYFWLVVFTGYAFYRGGLFKILWHYIQKVMS